MRPKGIPHCLEGLKTDSNLCMIVRLKIMNACKHREGRL